MTEDEAKTKWCPFTRAGSGTFPFNRTEGYSSPETLCIGSACMAWRVTGSKFKDGRTGKLSDRDLTGHGTWIETGFCGLAGSPQ